MGMAPKKASDLVVGDWIIAPYRNERFQTKVVDVGPVIDGQRLITLNEFDGAGEWRRLCWADELLEMA